MNLVFAVREHALEEITEGLHSLVRQNLRVRCFIPGAAPMGPEALRAMLMASRAKAPALSATQPAATPVPASSEEEAARKREADALDVPPAKRARTVSEPEAAADALLEEMAAEHPVEQAPTDDEALQGAQ